MKKYSGYKNSGIKWLGEIPIDWEVISLKHLVKIKITDGPHETPNAVDDGIPFVSAEAVQNHTINFESKWGYISKEDHLKYSKKCKPKNGDIFIVKSGATTGKVAYVNTEIEFNIWSPLALVRANEKSVISRYLFNYIISPLFQEQVQFSWSFGTQQNIGMGVIQNLLIVTPPLPEQQTIVNFLDYKTNQIDQFIANRQRQIELFKEQLYFKINDAITKGINKDAPTKTTDIQYVPNIPEHWDIRKFKSLTTILTCGYASTPEYVDESIGVAFLSAQNCRPFAMDLAKYNFIKPELHKQLTRNKKPQKGDVLVTRVGAGIGQACMIDIDLEFSVYVSLTHIRPNKEILSQFIVYFFNTEYCYQLNHEGTVVAGGQGNLNVKNVERYRIPLPPIEEQQEIIKYLDNYRSEMDNLISKYHKQIDFMQEYRTSLISQAVTGKIDVRDWKVKEKV